MVWECSYVCMLLTQEVLYVCKMHNGDYSQCSYHWAMYMYSSHLINFTWALVWDDAQVVQLCPFHVKTVQFHYKKPSYGFCVNNKETQRDILF